MGSDLCEKGTLTALDKCHVIRKITQAYKGLAPTPQNPLYKSATETLLTKFKDLERRQGWTDQEPNWPPEIVNRNARNQEKRPSTYNFCRDIVGYLGGDYAFMKTPYNVNEKKQEIPLVGLGLHRPLPFITENHHVMSSENYSLILLWDGWRENYMKVIEGLKTGKQPRASNVNLDSAFCGNRFEADFIPMKMVNGVKTHVTKEEFCNSEEGRKLLREFETPQEPSSTKLDVIANFLAIKHARTDSGIAMSTAAQKNDEIARQMEYSAIYFRKTEVFLGRHLNNRVRRDIQPYKVS